jgi:hypothetical protein
MQPSCTWPGGKKQRTQLPVEVAWVCMQNMRDLTPTRWLQVLPRGEGSYLLSKATLLVSIVLKLTLQLPSHSRGPCMHAEAFNSCMQVLEQPTITKNTECSYTWHHDKLTNTTHNIHSSEWRNVKGVCGSFTCRRAHACDSFERHGLHHPSLARAHSF